MALPKVSICIPVYEMHGMGVQYLKDLLTSIKKQSYANIEIVISDHSVSDDIEKFVHETFAEFVKRQTQILYYRFNEKRGNSSANMNNALKRASGQIIKPMFQDDFFCDNECIFEIVKLLEANPTFTWGAIGFIHTDENISHYYNDLIPYYNINIWTGYNTIGCPSVVFFKKDAVLFDESLIWLMDVAAYQELYKKYDKPLLMGRTGVAIRVWSQSISMEVSQEIKNKEAEYLNNIYGVKPPEPMVIETEVIKLD
jgi:glycosyltransferase involved in cell wall biosynthesis